MTRGGILTLSQIHRFHPSITKMVWGDEILIAHLPNMATGKVLKRYAGPDYHRGGLQWHREKYEAFYLHEGEVIVYYVQDGGFLRSHAMHPGECFIVPPGAVHSVQTVTDSIMFEVSNPVWYDRVNVEDQYDISKAVPD